MPRLLWAPNLRRVITELEQPAFPAEHAIQRTGGEDVEPLHARRKCVLVVRFHEEVEMVRLDREVTDAERLVPEALHHHAADRSVRATLTKTRHALLHAHDDVHRVIRAKLGSHAMCWILLARLLRAARSVALA